MSGVVTVGVLRDNWNSGAVASCAKANVVATYVTVPAAISRPAVAEAMGRLWGGYPLVGQAIGNALTNPFTGAMLLLPCAIPDGTPVVVSEIGG
jgi:hypothetical protein